MEIFKQYKKGNKLLNIYYDSDSESPREWDNLGKMICFHNRYNLGDETDLNSDDFAGWDELEKYLIKEKKAIIVYPLYLYDHSGITISITPFSCRWDSGKIGYIYATKEDIRKTFNVKNITKKLIEKVEQDLKNQVKIYDQYLTGDVYGFQLIENQKCDTCGTIKENHLDSCWGFYGTDFVSNGLFEHCDIKNIEEWEETK